MQNQGIRPRRICILGATGSIGRSALDVVGRSDGRLEVIGLSGRADHEGLAELVLLHRPKIAALACDESADLLAGRLRGRWDGEVWAGPDAAERLAALSEADTILNGIVGAAGLRPSSAALGAGKRLALANKESLVIAGEVITRELHSGNGSLLPVDSEHSALFQCLDGHAVEEIGQVILTASGGPFRGRNPSDLESVTPEQALNHPTWSMGPRITIDSATLLNKGFEVMEARWLFGLDPDRIGVWIHPQSIVHGLVQWKDGSTTAQLASPDMRGPILYALSYPERWDIGLGQCDLTALGSLQFEAVNPDLYPCLALAQRALKEGGTAPAVLNAADEVAVDAFLSGRIRFPRIADCLERVLDARRNEPLVDLDSVLDADRWARDHAQAVLECLE